MKCPRHPCPVPKYYRDKAPTCLCIEIEATIRRGCNPLVASIPSNALHKALKRSQRREVSG